MTKSVSKSEFKPRVLALLREVEQTGETLIVTDHGRPVIRIEAHRPTDETLDLLRGCVLRYEDPTEPVASDEWEASR